jgi:hypothetical protein
MNTVNALLLKLTSLVLTPFAGLPSQVALIVLSVVAGVLAAIAFRYTSNQAALKRVADQVRASLLGMRLFKDDLRSVFAAQGSLFKASGLRLWHSLPPLVVLIVPFVFLLAQLAMWYEFRPLAPGERAIVEVQIAPEAWDEYSQLQLSPPDGIELAGPVLGAPAGEADNPAVHSITWDLRPLKAPPDDEPLTLRFQLNGSEVAEKQLVVSDNPDASRLSFVSPLRPGTSFWDRLLYPGEPAFNAGSPIRRIEIAYDSRTNTLFGYSLHWIITFFVVSVLAALALKPVIKVQF